MKQQADKGRTERSFEIGDWVLLKLQPHRKVTVRMGNQKKFSPKYYGPFKVIAKHRGEVPSGQHIEVNVCDENGLLAAQPLALLDRKMVKQRNAVSVYRLIQWTNGSVEDATWEPLDKLSKDYPEFDLNS
ncbi:putative nucleotidyltransferase, ribonuclease H [Tanacetum coccineum]